MRFWKLCFHLWKGLSYQNKVLIVCLFFLWLLIVLSNMHSLKARHPKGEVFGNPRTTPQYHPVHQASVEEEEVWKTGVPILVSAEHCCDAGQDISLRVTNTIHVCNAICEAVILFSSELLLLRTVWKAQAEKWGSMTIYFHLLSSTLSN